MEFLKKLGIKKKNFGASTGVKWFGSETNEELKIYSPINGKYYENSMFSGGREFDYVIDSYSQLRYGFVKNWDIGVQASILGGISGDFGYQVSNKTIQSAFYLGFGLNQKEVLKDINTKEGFSTSMYAIYSFDTSNYLLLQ